MQSSDAKQIFLSSDYEEKFISSSYRTTLLFSHYRTLMETKRLGSKKCESQDRKRAWTNQVLNLWKHYGTLKTQFLPIVKRHADNTAFGKQRVTVISYGKFSRVLFHPSIGPLGKEHTLESGSKAASFLCFCFCFLFFFVFCCCFFCAAS